MAELYTCQQVAERYKVEVITVWEWIRKKKLPAIRIGRSYRIDANDLAEFERRGKTTSEV